MNRDPRRLRLLLVLLVLVALALVTLDQRSGRSALDGLRDGAATVLGPFQRGLGAVTGAIGDVGGGITGRDARRADRLQVEVDRLQQELAARDAQDMTEQQLAALYGLTGAGQYRTRAARVIAYGGSLGFEWTATLDVGSGDGIVEDMTVVNGDGLVGRVTRVTPTTSQVLLANDASSSVGGRLEASPPGEVGVVDGAGQSPMVLRLFSAQAQVTEGQRVVTFGSTYVPGVPIGEITTVEETPGALERRAQVRPFVDFGALDVVGVVVEVAAGDPRDAVLPPRPPDADPFPPPPPPDGEGDAEADGDGDG
jgi:rod shape-determining protein MreC